MNVVDSSGWLEYFANGKNAAEFVRPIEETQQLLVPSISLAEVFKRILQQRDEQSALQAIAHMNQGQVVDLNLDLALRAARLGFDMKLPLADSVILATAQHHHALLWTQDDDFKGVPGVRYIPK